VSSSCLQGKLDCKVVGLEALGSSGALWDLKTQTQYKSKGLQCDASAKEMSMEKCTSCR